MRPPSSGAPGLAALALDAREVKRRLLLGAALLVVAMLAARALGAERLLGSLAAVAGAGGAAGVLLLAATYVPAALLGLPLAPLTIAAGLIHGPLAGAALALPALACSSSLAFLGGRRLARDPAALAAGSCGVARAARAVGRGGFRLVLVLRLLPVAPWSVLNYAFGAAPCRYRDFLAGTLLGSLPSALAYAWLGSTFAGR